MFPSLAPYKPWIALALILLLSWLHLRGTHAAAIVVGIPTYLFVAVMLLMVVLGIVRWHGVTVVPMLPESQHLSDRELVFLTLKAFASGCTALAGIEAVSNDVANFREPAQKTAKGALTVMGVIVAELMLGISMVSSIYRIVPNNLSTVMSQIAALNLKCSFVYEITEYRNTEDLLIRHIEREEQRQDRHQHLTVVIPSLVTRNPVKQSLHNETSRVLMQRLSRHRYVYVFQVPYLFE